MLGWAPPPGYVATCTLIDFEVLRGCLICCVYIATPENALVLLYTECHHEDPQN